MNAEDIFHSVMGLIVGVSLGGIIVGSSFYGSGRDGMEKTAIHAGYGTYDEGGSFKWKHEMEKETLLKDFEFLKRLEENRKTAPVPEIVPLPKTQDLFN